MDSSSGTSLYAQVTGNGFRGFGTYVENPSRPYIDVSNCLGTWDLFTGGNNWGDRSVAPKDGPLINGDGPLARARFSILGGVCTLDTSASRNVSFVNYVGTGRYTINFTRALPSAGNVYSFAANSPAVIIAFAESTSSLTVQCLSDLAGTTGVDVSLMTVLVFGDNNYP
jgi:hypothetical protein